MNYLVGTKSCKELCSKVIFLMTLAHSLDDQLSNELILDNSARQGLTQKSVEPRLSSKIPTAVQNQKVAYICMA